MPKYHVQRVSTWITTYEVTAEDEYAAEEVLTPVVHCEKCDDKTLVCVSQEYAIVDTTVKRVEEASAA
jgi:hypothetical protein